jgi:hypothetical protein
MDIDNDIEEDMISVNDTQSQPSSVSVTSSGHGGGSGSVGGVERDLIGAPLWGQVNGRGTGRLAGAGVAGNGVRVPPIPSVHSQLASAARARVQGEWNTHTGGIHMGEIDGIFMGDEDGEEELLHLLGFFITHAILAGFMCLT